MYPRQHSGTGSMTSTSTISLSTDVIMKNTSLEPCAASAKLVLYSQGSSVLCLRHDTLELERRFERHAEEVISIAIDNTDVDSPRVVSVDASKTAIVWDLETGEEVSRFTSYEDIRVAAWMKNGNLAFGDTIGNVTLFDPKRIESISARTIFDPLTAIAPAADCRSFALGYQNGSILVAALTPSFTILHTLTTTSLSPSPITSLAWHASSSRQKSDMLAVQTHDGDLRVWSVPKTIETDDSARVVRVLKRPDSNQRGNNWLAWSRNGRIVQYSEGISTIWDVRTKKVAWEEIPTMGDLAGICVYGASGALFTFGKDNTVQQFSLYPPTLKANVLHLPTVPPPSPPVSIEEKQDEMTMLHDTLHTDDEMGPVRETSPMTAIAMTPLGRIAQELERLEHMEQQPLGGLGISNVPKERSGSVSSNSSSGSRHKHNLSSSSKGTVGSNAESEYSSATTVSPGAGRKGSVGAVSLASPRKQHPLRQELHISPDVVHAQAMMSPVADVNEIFSFTKQRMVNVTYESPRIGGPQSNMNEDDLRREMLFCLFGWKGDIESLISDECKP
ncbi:WD40-repeat-containing domain protein [Geopyxis carbonaria]|nr:WD40-repeat-containing domain protein [Geopyxis carbonaria]